MYVCTKNMGKISTHCVNFYLLLQDFLAAYINLLYSNFKCLVEYKAKFI